MFDQPLTAEQVAMIVKDESAVDLDEKKRKSLWQPTVSDKAVQTDSFDMKAVSFTIS